MSLIFFRTPENGLNGDNSAIIAHKIAKSKYFVVTHNESDSPINSFPNDIVCWGQCRPSKIIGGGGGGGASHRLHLLFCKSVYRLSVLENQAVSIAKQLCL